MTGRSAVFVALMVLLGGAGACADDRFPAFVKTDAQVQQRLPSQPVQAQQPAQNQAAAPLTPPGVTQPPPSGRQPPADFVGVAGPLVDAVVNISSERHMRQRQESPQSPLPPPFNDLIPQNPEGGPEQPPTRGTALGSGFVIDPSGYVVTNNHVVEDAETITVVLHDQREMKAKLVGRDTRTDLALLKVEADGALPYVQWGNSDRVQVGEWILAIGNPFGLGGTVTAGIISATARDIGAGPYDSFLQTDASINRGNSGGPMFNMEGQVIGVNTAIFSPTGGSIGIGFAIPASQAKPVIDQLRNSGVVTRGWLGVAIQPVTREIAESLGLGKPEGALVAEVTKGGPADKAGLRVGDVILRYNGQSIDESHRLPRLVADTNVGSQAQLLVWREGNEHNLEAHIAQLKPQVARAEPQPEPTIQPGLLGLALAPLSGTARNELGLDPNDRGVLVRGVDPNSEAADRGISPGDVIRQVDQHAVGTPEEVRQLVESARKSKRSAVLMLVRHGDNNHFIPLPLSEPQSSSVPGSEERGGGG